MCAPCSARSPRARARSPPATRQSPPTNHASSRDAFACHLARGSDAALSPAALVIGDAEREADALRAPARDEVVLGQAGVARGAVFGDGALGEAGAEVGRAIDATAEGHDAGGAGAADVRRGA